MLQLVVGLISNPCMTMLMLAAACLGSLWKSMLRYNQNTYLSCVCIAAYLVNVNLMEPNKMH